MRVVNTKVTGMLLETLATDFKLTTDKAFEVVVLPKVLKKFFSYCRHVSNRH